MAGAWEISPPEVLVAILTREMVATKWAVHFRDLQLPGGSNVIFLSGMPFDHARNAACEKMLELGFTWLFFLDDDVMPPPDTYHKLASRGKDIISGLYYRRNEPIMPVMLRHGQPRPSFITNFQSGDIVEADMVGAGCLLIHRRVLERMKRPWFEWMVDRTDLPELERTSEDFTFCIRAKQQGFQTYVDTGIKCIHAGIGKSECSGTYTPLVV